MTSRQVAWLVVSLVVLAIAAWGGHAAGRSWAASEGTAAGEEAAAAVPDTLLEEAPEAREAWKQGFEEGRLAAEEGELPPRTPASLRVEAHGGLEVREGEGAGSGPARWRLEFQGGEEGTQVMQWIGLSPDGKLTLRTSLFRKPR